MFEYKLRLEKCNMFLYRSRNIAAQFIMSKAGYRQEQFTMFESKFRLE